MPLRRGDRTGKIENAAQEIPLRLARAERRDARNQQPAASAWLVGPREPLPEPSLWVCQPELCRRKAVWGTYGQDHRCPIRCSGSSPNVAFGPVQLAIPCPAVMTCAGFRVALPSRGSLESSKTWVVGEASFIGAGRIPSRQPCLALGQLGRRGSSAKKLISLVEALLAADCWGLDLHALHSFRCNSCSGSLV